MKFALFLLMFLLTSITNTESMELQPNKPLARDAEVAEKVGKIIRAQDIPMIDFIFVDPLPNGEIVISGTLKSEDDIARIIELSNKVRGVNSVISKIEVGNYQFMYENKIKNYIEYGYKRYANYSIENKKRIYKNLIEFLVYKDKLDKVVVNQVEQLADLLDKDIQAYK